MEHITFKRATKADTPVIEQLAHRIWKIHYPDIVSIAQLDYMLGRGYTPEALEKQMDEGQIFTLVYADGEPVGYTAVSEKTPHNFFIHKFYVDTTQHRKGIGSRAFKDMINNYCEGFETIRLQVNRRNVKAVNFYFKMGMTIEYQKDFDIGEGFSMDDFVMLLVSRKGAK